MSLFEIQRIDNLPIWQSNMQDPHFANPNDVRYMPCRQVIELVRPMYFDARDMLRRVGLSVESIHREAVNRLCNKGEVAFLPHSTAKEDFTSTEGDQVHLKRLSTEEILEFAPALEILYGGQLLAMAQSHAGNKRVCVESRDKQPFDIFGVPINKNLPIVRMDTHCDGHSPTVIINLSLNDQVGYTAIGHPDLLVGRDTLAFHDIMNDPRTVLSRMAPGCGVVVDVRKTPHFGFTIPAGSSASEEYRLVLDANYCTMGEVIDSSVFMAYGDQS
jgi:hypothetical protein